MLALVYSTIRTARTRASGENLFVVLLVIAPSSQELGPSTKPARVRPEIALWTLYPTRRLLSARVSAFLDFLREAFPHGMPDELAAYVGRSAPQGSN
jgi:DNA-binding transcriptional LysR family regulator